MRLRGEAQATVVLRNDHAEETFILDELPSLRRQILTGMGDIPVVQHAAQLLDLVIKEGLLFVAQSRLG